MSQSTQPSPGNSPQGQRKTRWLPITTAVVLFIIFNVVMLWHRVLIRTTAIVPPDFHKVAPDIDARIEDTQLKTLRAESLQESARNLSDVDMFFWPGLPAESELIWMPHQWPLSPTIGVRDVGQVASNRRFLKVLEELTKLSKDEASRLIIAEIERSLTEYQKLFVNDLAQRFGPDSKNDAAKDSSCVVAVVYQTSSNNGETPTQLGERYKLFALALCAGNLGLEKCHSVLLKVAQRAKEDYWKLRQYKDPNDVTTAWLVAVQGGLYNRQILGTGLLGTSPKLGGLDGARRFHLELKSLPLPLYDVQATQFDLHGRVGAVPVDYSRGRLMLRYLGDIDDQLFDALLAAVEGADNKKP
jgi:hypothetical protein